MGGLHGGDTGGHASALVGGAHGLIPTLAEVEHEVEWEERAVIVQTTGSSRHAADQRMTADDGEDSSVGLARMNKYLRAGWSVRSSTPCRSGACWLVIVHRQRPVLLRNQDGGEQWEEDEKPMSAQRTRPSGSFVDTRRYGEMPTNVAGEMGSQLKRLAMETGLRFTDVRDKSDADIRALMLGGLLVSFVPHRTVACTTPSHALHLAAGQYPPHVTVCDRYNTVKNCYLTVLQIVVRQKGRKCRWNRRIGAPVDRRSTG
jgi:hypothetical protein